jgi:hypothetical protein
LNTKLLHKNLKCSGACHEVTFLTAVKDSIFVAAGSIGRSFCLKPDDTASGTPAEPRLAARMQGNNGNGCTILNSGFGIGIKRKRFTANPITRQPAGLFQKSFTRAKLPEANRNPGNWLAR